MEQLILHLIGDYVTQTHRMATRKTASWAWAFAHAIVYSLPFMLLTTEPFAVFVILYSHAVIDRLRLARWVCWLKNWPDAPLRSATGYPLKLPAYLSGWLFIITDNTLHLTINYAALRWL
jgi:hypothetical protein